MKASPRAFSLVEVVMALGIVSTVMVGLLGLVAVAFGQLRQSMERTTQTQIVQSLAAEIKMLDYSALTNTNSLFRSQFPRKYDVEGQAISTGVSNTPLYEVVLDSGPSKVPGASSNQSAQQVVIKIAKSNQTNTSMCYSVWAVDNGR
jgi:uncharacterized protein (TIGR02598 family)